MKRLLALMFLFLIQPALANSENPTTPSLMVMPAANKRISLSYFAYASSQLSDNQEGPGSVYTYHLVSLGYRLSPQSTIALSPAVTHETEGRRYGTLLPAETKMADVSLDYIDRQALPLPQDFRAKAVYRIIFNTDPNKENTKTPLGFGAKFEITRDLSSRWTLGYYPKFTYLQQSEVEQWLALSYYFNDHTSISQGIGIKSQFSQSELVQTLLNVDINDNMMVSLGISQEFNNMGSWVPYRDTESAYLLMASMWM